MDWRHPHAAVSPGAIGAVLDALSSSADLVTGREVARRASLSAQGALDALNRLVAAGVVIREERPVIAYRLNPEHVAFDAVMALSDLRNEVFRRMANAVTSWTIRCTNATVFGSVARGDGSNESDLDLLLVRPGTVDADDARWVAQIGALAQAVRGWTGNDLAVVEVAEDELVGADTTLGDLLSAAQREGLTVGGTPLRSLLPLQAR